MDKNLILIRSPVCVDTALDKRSIILNTETGNYIELNETSTFIWKLLKEEKRFKDILDEVLNEYSVSSEEAEKEISDFIIKSIHEKIIETKENL
tara:strand:+ start:1981 stop:2262 length:282 start_codon:yes stop_codon:yes gene_type:complete